MVELSKANDEQLMTELLIRFNEQPENFERWFNLFNKCGYSIIKIKA